MKIDLPGVWEPLDLTVVEDVDPKSFTETDRIFLALIQDLIEHERWKDLDELRETLRKAEDTMDWAVLYFEVADLLRDRKKDELTREKLEGLFNHTHILRGWVSYQVNSLIGPDVFPEVILASRKTPIARNLKGRFRDRSQRLLVLQLVGKYFPDFLENSAQFFSKGRNGDMNSLFFPPQPHQNPSAAHNKGQTEELACGES